MREFAGRTHQDGIPELAAEFVAPEIDAAAMPVRAELWRTDSGPELRLVGVVWGGRAPVACLSIQCQRSHQSQQSQQSHPSHPTDGDGGWEPVDRIERFDRAADASGWRLWFHRFRAPRPGPVAIRLRVDDPGVRNRRLDEGHYTRVVDVAV